MNTPPPSPISAIATQRQSANACGFTFVLPGDLGMCHSQWLSEASLLPMKVFEPGVKTLVARTPKRSDANVDAWVTSGIWIKSI